MFFDIARLGEDIPIVARKVKRLRFGDKREFWEDFGFHLGPWRMYVGPYRPFRIRYHRTEKTHVLHLRINPDVKREEIKARLIEPGILEIEWPRKIRGEEIPIE